jgi:hypothetical protein
MTQLAIQFPTDRTPPQQHDYPWSSCFGNFRPKVGQLWQIADVIIPEYGYTYGDPVRIISIEGDHVTCVVQNLHDKNFWKNGKKYHVKLENLWPCPHMLYND